MKELVFGILAMGAALASDRACAISVPLLDEQHAAVAVLSIRAGEAALTYAGSHSEIYFPGMGDPVRGRYAVTVSGLVIAYDKDSCVQHTSWNAQLEPDFAMRFVCVRGDLARGADYTLMSFMEGHGGDIDLVLPSSDELRDAPYALIFDGNGRFLAIWSREGLPVGAGRQGPQVLSVGEGGVSLDLVSSILGGRCINGQRC
ncbi:MAG: hypothetical protein K2P58_14185 [Hyphomonadaceae bacterium]|nr:hypothetical protein [Hyphomonadaceae bacterium]